MNINLQEYADKLCVSLEELRELLNAQKFTFTRWVKGKNSVPGSVVACLKAWSALHSAGVAWQPNQVTIFIDKNGKLCALDQNDKESIKEWKQMRGIPDIDHNRIYKISRAVQKVAVDNNIELTVKFHDKTISPDPIEFSVKP